MCRDSWCRVALAYIPASADGISTREAPNKMGCLSDRNSEICFRDVKIDWKWVVEDAWGKFMATVAPGSLGSAAMAVGVAQRALSEVIVHAEGKL